MTDHTQNTLSLSPKTTVGHCKKNDCDVYAGRARRGGELKHLNNTDVGERGWLGNPYVEDIQDEAYSLEASIAAYRDAFHERVETDPEFRNELAQYQGCVIGCWCRTVDSDSPSCHADVIAEYLNQL